MCLGEEFTLVFGKLKNDLFEVNFGWFDLFCIEWDLLNYQECKGGFNGVDKSSKGVVRKDNLSKVCQTKF